MGGAPRNFLSTLSFFSLLFSWTGAVRGDSAEEIRAEKESRPKETFEDRFWSHIKDIPAGPGILSFGGSLRVRYEFQNHYNRKTYGEDTEDGFLLERFRLNMDYLIKKNLHAFVEFQDAHVWGSDFSVDDFGGKSPDENPFDLRQAFVEWRRICATPFGFKVGRQRIAYGDGRIWGPGEWGNVGRYFWDGVKVLYETGPVSIEGLFARRVRHESDCWDFDDRHYDFDAYGIYATLKKLPVLVDLFFAEKRGDSPRVCGSRQVEKEERHTFGSRFDGEFLENFDYGGTFAYQFGEWGDDDIRAYGLNARLGYSFVFPWKPRIGVEFTYGSGDSDPNDGTHETFDSVFGSRDKLYGRMNILCWCNLEDYQAGLSVKPVENFTAKLDYHFFRLAEEKDSWYYSPSKGLRRDPTGSSGQDIGQEIDVTLKLRLSKRFDLIALFGLFFPGSFVKHTGPHKDAQWVAFQALYSF